MNLVFRRGSSLLVSVHWRQVDPTRAGPRHSEAFVRPLDVSFGLEWV
jgi:hypothetical protein